MLDPTSTSGQDTLDTLFELVEQDYPIRVGIVFSSTSSSSSLTSKISAIAHLLRSKDKTRNTVNDFLKRLRGSNEEQDVIRIAQDVSSTLFGAGVSESEISAAFERDSSHMKFAEQSANYVHALGLTTLSSSPTFVFNGRLKLDDKEDLKSWIMTSLRTDMSTYQRLIYTQKMPMKANNPLKYLMKENQLISSYSPALESLFLNEEPKFVMSMDEKLDWTYGELVSSSETNARVSIVIKGGSSRLLKEASKRLPKSTRIATMSSSSSHVVIVNGWILHSKDAIQVNDLIVLDEIERTYRANLVSEITSHIDELDDDLFMSLCAFLGTSYIREQRDG